MAEADDPREEEPEGGPAELGGDDIEELRDALEDLRREIQVRFGSVGRSDSSQSVDGDEDEPFDLERFVMGLARRLSTLGMSERSGSVDEFGMDEAVLRSARPVFDLLFERYFRVELHGIEHLPEEGPCLMVANRSGLLPWDGLMLAYAIERFHPSGQRPRFLVADWLITLPFVQPYLARLGGVRACRENAERLLRDGCSVIAFPEGVKGAAKVFRERYRLKRFGRGGVIRVALENEVPLVPVGIVGAEEAHPILFKLGTPARAFGYPFMPVTPTFPFLGPFGALPLPTKWVIRIGQPTPIEHLGPDDAADALLLSRLTEELREDIQSLVDQGLAQRTSVWG